MTKKNEIKIKKDMTIGDVTGLYPEAIEILMMEGIHCVGCGAANHETIEEGLTAHSRSTEEIDDIVKRMNEALEDVKSDPNSITLTKKAADKIQEIMKNEKKDNHALRIDVKPGGCAGFEYVLDFDNKKAKDDKEIKSEGVKIYIKPTSFDMMKGARIDFIETLQGAGFKITNPNAHNTCGCGDSFN